jgi:hypothetical protein
LPPGVSGFWVASSIDREVDRLDDRTHVLTYTRARKELIRYPSISE